MLTDRLLYHSLFFAECYKDTVLMMGGHRSYISYLSVGYSYRSSFRCRATLDYMQLKPSRAPLLLLRLRHVPPTKRPSLDLCHGLVPTLGITSNNGWHGRLLACGRRLSRYRLRCQLIDSQTCSSPIHGSGPPKAFFSSAFSKFLSAVDGDSFLTFSVSSSHG